MTIAGQGTVALVGSGEFLPISDPLDRVLLERLGEAARVVVLPTASAPDGGAVPQRWARLGEEHFTHLGATVDPVMLLTRPDAESSEFAARIAAANFIYLSGGKPTYLLETLRDTACWRAIRGVFDAGGVVAGCSAGAMALAGATFAFPNFLKTHPGLGLAPGLAVVPHFDELPGWMTGVVGNLPAHVIVAGVEGATGLVGAGNAWAVAGRGGVTIFHDHHKTRYTAGQTVPLNLAG